MMARAFTGRRSFLKHGVAFLLAGGGTGAWVYAKPVDGSERASPMPRLQDGQTIDVGETALWYNDSGGDGEVVILLHPATGSGLVWEHQIPDLIAAGFRVIVYSRRGHIGSGPIDPDNPGSGTGDLIALVDALQIERFHLVGSAAGAFLVSDAALAVPDRLLSGTIASSFGGFVDPDYRRILGELKPPGFDNLPASFRELGPDYRAANPSGVRRWEALERISKHGPRARQAMLNKLSWQNIEKIRTPVMMLTGGADLYMPPSLLKVASSHFVQCETHVIPKVGHSVYWENASVFNALVIDFISRNSQSG